jgi:EamA domain-containing membrane protein RarD
VLDDKLIWGIRLMRGLSAAVEVCAVLLLFRMQDSRSMLRLNGLLGMIGPLIFISVSALGLADSLGKVQPVKLVVILAGVVLVVWGTRS